MNVENHGEMMMSTEETTDMSTRAVPQYYQQTRCVASRRSG
jgi:hypothetical protein